MFTLSFLWQSERDFGETQALRALSQGAMHKNEPSLTTEEHYIMKKAAQ